MSSESLEELRERLGAESRAYQSAVDSIDEAAAAYFGVNRTDLRCMDVLMQLGPTTPGMLSTRLGLTTGSVTTMLDRLARLGYITRSPDPADRRKVTVRLTDTATEKAWQVYGPIAEEGAAAAVNYTAVELRLLIGFLRAGREFQERHHGRIQRLK